MYGRYLEVRETKVFKEQTGEGRVGDTLQSGFKKTKRQGEIINSF